MLTDQKRAPLPMNRNPIAAQLGLAPAADKHTLKIGGKSYELYPAIPGICETLFQLDPPRADGDKHPGFTLLLAVDHKMTLGQYLIGGGKRAEAEAAVDAAAGASVGISSADTTLAVEAGP